MANSGFLSTLGYDAKHHFELAWSVQSVSNVRNTSSISYTFKLFVHQNQAGSAETLTENVPFDISFDGKKVHIGQVAKGKYTSGEDGHLLVSDTITIKHNADGTKSLPYMFTITAAAGFSARTKSNTTDLPPINRKATIISATNFTDLEKPSITYNNPAQGSVTQLEACISLTGEKDDIPYRRISPTNTSYAFTLTADEKSLLKRAVVSGNQIPVIFRIKTLVDGITYYDDLTKTFTIAKPEPTIFGSVIDVNSRTLALTGDAAKLIKYASNAKFTIGATAVEGATITSQYVINGSHRVENTNTGTINAVDSNTFYFSATDSRGFTTNYARVVELVPYIKLTGNVTIEQFLPNGTMTFNIKGKYYNGSFGLRNNTLDLDYQLKPDGEDISQVYRLIDIKPTVDEQGNYEFSHTITGLDYTKNYELSVYAIDAVGNSISISTIAAPIPVFDWSKDDFNFNVPITVCNRTQITKEGQIHGTTTEGEKIQVIDPCNGNNNLVIGYGNYAAETKTPSGDKAGTNLYGNTVNLMHKNGITINWTPLADFVTEQASNGTWHYRKWNSGRVELSGYQNISNEACNTALGGWYRTAVKSAPAFPFTVNNPKTTVSFESGGTGALVWNTTLESSSKPADYYLIRPTSSAAISGMVIFYTTGTWK